MADDPLTPAERRAALALPWPLPAPPERAPRRPEVYSPAELAEAAEAMSAATAAYVAAVDERQAHQAAGDPGAVVALWDRLAAKLTPEPPRAARVEDEAALGRWLDQLDEGWR